MSDNLFVQPWRHKPTLLKTYEFVYRRPIDWKNDEEIVAWCYANIKGCWEATVLPSMFFCFELKEDAALFVLHWPLVRYTGSLRFPIGGYNV